MSAPDFPILLETWRTCLKDEFDLENLKRLLDELSEGRIELGEVRTKTATPFAAGLIWQRTNKYMYEDDSPETGKTSGIGDDLFRLAISGESPPPVPPKTIDDLNGKLQRTAPGYSPAGADDLLDWIKERLLIPGDEWEELLAAIERDHGVSAPKLSENLKTKVFGGRLPGAERDVFFAVENAPFIAFALGFNMERIRFRPITDGEVPELEKILSSPRLRLESFDNDSEIKSPSISDFISQWLSYYGPLHTRFVNEVTGIPVSTLKEIFRNLERDGRIVLELDGQSGEIAKVCDRENMEILLRMARKARRPDFAALPVEKLQLFLAAYQGVAASGDTIEDLQDRLERLFGYCAPAKAWEEFILPCRLNPYYPAWLDSLIQSSDLCWFGCGDRKIGFAFKEDLELFNPDSAPDGKKSRDEKGLAEEEISAFFPDKKGRYGFFEIAEHSGFDSEKTALQIWNFAWKGKIGADTFEAVRSGILNNFKPAGVGNSAVRPRRLPSFAGRGGFNRWKSTRPLAGSWRVFDRFEEEVDEMILAELKKDRARQLFRRYGILFRELVTRETDLLQWKSLFKTLRLMELSGEIISGRFFEGAQGLQFMSHEAFRFLKRGLPEDAVYWMNAIDPASLCGTGFEGWKSGLPPRSISNFLVFHGDKLVIEAKRNCRALDVRVTPEEPNLFRYYEFFKSLLGRAFNPRGFIMVESINGKVATESAYRASLEDFGFVGDYKGLELRRGMNV